MGSVDGKNYYTLGQTTDLVEKENGKCTMTIDFQATYAQYVKVFIKNSGTVKEGSPGAGNTPGFLWMKLK